MYCARFLQTHTRRHCPGYLHTGTARTRLTRPRRRLAPAGTLASATRSGGINSPADSLWCPCVCSAAVAPVQPYAAAHIQPLCLPIVSGPLPCAAVLPLRVPVSRLRGVAQYRTAHRATLALETKSIRSAALTLSSRRCTGRPAPTRTCTHACYRVKTSLIRGGVNGLHCTGEGKHNAQQTIQMSALLCAVL